LELFDRARSIQVHIEARNAFEFIKCAAGDIQTAAGNHWHPKFITGQQRRQDERSLSANRPGRMFVDLGRRVWWILEYLAALQHRFGQRSEERRVGKSVKPD